MPKGGALEVHYELCRNPKCGNIVKRTYQHKGFYCSKDCRMFAWRENKRRQIKAKQMANEAESIWLVDDGGEPDWVAVDVASRGARPVRLTRREAKLAAVEFVRHNRGDCNLFAKYLGVSLYSVKVMYTEARMQCKREGMLIPRDAGGLQWRNEL